VTEGGWMVSTTPRPFYLLERELVPILEEAKEINVIIKILIF
jgi:hypothetical protein